MSERERKSRQVMIEGMEKAVSKNTSDEFVRPLVANYINILRIISTIQ